MRRPARPNVIIMHRYANPARFVRIADAWLPWLIGATVLAFAIGLPWALIFSPGDYQQGDTVRIMYVHVPAAHTSLAAYMSLAVGGFVWLVWKHPLADLAAKAAAPLGAMFCALTLATGSLWGKPMWGTYWDWDGRLTSMLVLLFLFLGYMLLRAMIEDPEKSGKAGALLAIVGVINIPIIKFSVQWWTSLHQPASIKLTGITMHESFLGPLLMMSLAYTLYFATVLLWRIKAEIEETKLNRMRAAMA